MFIKCYYIYSYLNKNDVSVTHKTDYLVPVSQIIGYNITDKRIMTLDREFLVESSIFNEFIKLISSDIFPNRSLEE